MFCRCQPAQLAARVALLLRMPARRLLMLLALLILTAGCASAPEPGPVAQTTAGTGETVVVVERTVIVQRLVTATPASARQPAVVTATQSAVITATRGTAAKAELMRNSPAGRCRWDIYIALTGFAPDSQITVDSDFDEVVCLTGEVVRGGHWTEPYGERTSAAGRLVIGYLHEATGDYLYTFTDEQGNRATVTLHTAPEGGFTGGATATPRAPTPQAAGVRTASPTAAVEDPWVIVKSATLNLRGGPGTNYPVIGQAQQGDRLYPTGQVGGCAWFQVGAPGMDGLAWVAGGGQFVTLTVPCATIPAQELIPPTPLPAPTSVPRPRTGLLSRAGAFGGGLLRVLNGTDSDGVVILVTAGDAPAQAAYIRAGDRFEMTQIADGAYRLYFTKGEGWDVGAQQFTRNVTRQRFEDTLRFTGGNGYEVTLYGVTGGNAATEEVAPGQFPGLP